MAQGNFSNGGVDTFDELKQYIGIRMQQGVPLLDRDLNELEDIRRYYELMLRRHYLGDGAPNLSGFQIVAPKTRAPGDFVISSGRFMVNGYDVWNPKDRYYSSQPGAAPLSAAEANEMLTVYLQPSVVRVDGDDDPDLLNRQDINLETCLRDRLSWAVQVASHPQRPPAGAVALARIRRPLGTREITSAMIADLRRAPLNLAAAIDATETLRGQVGALEGRVALLQQEIEEIKAQLARIFWDVQISPSQRRAHFGGKVSLKIKIEDGLGTPIHGAQLALSTDWGVLEPAMAVTDSTGHATVELLGVHSETPPPRSEIAILQRAVSKIDRVTLANPGSIEYARLRFEPEEMTLISRYSPPNTLLDLSRNLPSGPIVARPASRTATVTVHVTEAGGGVVRGVGSLQVSFGLWVRDWAKTKVVEAVGKVSVGARIGDLMRRGINGQRTFEYGAVNQELPTALQAINDDTYSILGSSLFSQPAAGAREVLGAGTLGQVIAQEASAAVGAKTNAAVEEQIDRFVADQGIVLDDSGGREAKTRIVQASSQISAGFAQDARQRFTARKGF
jgi:hypothetical protein